MEKNLSYFLLGNIEMAKISTEKLIDISNDPHFKAMLKDDLKEYDAFYIRLKNEKNPNDELKDINPLLKFSSQMSINVQTFNDKSNVQLSQMLLDGFGMGIKDAKENIDKAKKEGEDPKIIAIAEDYRNLLMKNCEKYSKIVNGGC